MRTLKNTFSCHVRVFYGLQFIFCENDWAASCIKFFNWLQGWTDTVKVTNEVPHGEDVVMRKPIDMHIGSTVNQLKRIIA